MDTTFELVLEMETPTAFYMISLFLKLFKLMGSELNIGTHRILTVRVVENITILTYDLKHDNLNLNFMDVSEISN